MYNIIVGEAFRLALFLIIKIKKPHRVMWQKDVAY